MCSATDALGNTTVTRFDALGRATETISPIGSVTATQYDNLGRQSKTIDALGNETRYLYDELGRLWKVVDALGGVTEYGFDERGNRTSVRDAMGNITRFEYDLNNRLTKEINPLGTETTFTYDATGSRATRTDGNGFTTIYRYDTNRRLSEIEYPDGKKTQYTFDERGNKTFEGHLDPNVNFAAASRTFVYDDLNRLRSMTDSSLGKSIQYEFDENGNRSAVIDAEGGVTRWEYDRNNRPVRVTDADSQITRFEYDAAGRRKKVVYPNGVWTEYLYDPSAQLTHMVTRDRTNLTLQGWHYVYDLRGNRTSKTDHAGNVESYLYDPLGRLTQTTYPDGRVVSWSFDAVGNRLTQTENGSLTTYSYNAANQIQTMTSSTGAQTTFGFDGNGNMLWKSEPSGTTYYTWDFENRLRQVAAPSGVTNFGYDANGIRVFKESGGVRTDYLVDTVSVLAEYEAGARKSVYTLGSRIDEIVSQTNDQGKFWYLADALGSVTGLTDSGGRVIKTYRYGAWGDDAGTTGPDLRNPYRWTGREWDHDGLQYNRARYYFNFYFISNDPFGNQAFYAPNPISYRDPLGLTIMLLESDPTMRGWVLLASYETTWSRTYFKIAKETYRRVYFRDITKYATGHVYFQAEWCADIGVLPYMQKEVGPDDLVVGVNLKNISANLAYSTDASNVLVHELAHVAQIVTGTAVNANEVTLEVDATWVEYFHVQEKSMESKGAIKKWCLTTADFPMCVYYL
ncbi:MAG: RHS repeat protein [Ignavibacteriae bacterium]|nr:RHS repeat protein [Ignavibacteriota bacterium]